MRLTLLKLLAAAKGKGDPLTGEKAAALLREGITREEFFKLLSE